MIGDFDITTSFDQFEAAFPKQHKYAGVALVACLESDPYVNLWIHRRRSGSEENHQYIETTSQHPGPERDIRWDTWKNRPNESDSGKLRLARRGKTVYYLYADGDSTQFRLHRKQEVSQDPVKVNGLWLFTQVPLEQRVWKFGYGQFNIDAERTTAFKNFPYWDGTRWRGGVNYPDEEIGWTSVRAVGGHPGRLINAIRRWVAPVDGTLSVSGALQRDATPGNGIQGRLISSRSGQADQWVVRTGSVATNADAIDVQRGDTIDFMVDPIDSQAESDSFSWTVQLDLKTKDGRQLTFDSESGFHGPARSNADVVIAAACLTQDWLQPIGESILKTKLEQTYGPESLRIRPFLRYAHGMAIQKRYEDASDLLADSDLAFWLPSSTKRAWPSPQGGVRPIWLSDRDHILHAFGPRNDYLLFKYPLTGDFEFSCETQIGGSGGTDGCVAYGGLGYEVWAARNLAKIFDASFQKIAEFHCPFIDSNRVPTFQRFAIKSTAEGITFSANGHPTWAEPSKDLTSPWIGLRSWGERVPIFRNFKIVGNPVIPREVKMSAGNSLRGWVADYYGESTPPPPGQAQAGFQAFFQRMMTSYDWSASGDMIHGAKRITVNEEAVAQSRLSYLRPLQNGESISYEFEYQPSQLEVHPTLGRIAFLIEPGGVRLHWMTDGDYEWTGLAEDNAVVEPLNRRGPKPLPLLAGEWNRVTVDLKRNTLTLSLNNETIYIRKMDPDNEFNERTFGFYHDACHSAVQVRNVVMRGEWPERLTATQLENLAAVDDSDRSDADRDALNYLFQEQYLADSVLQVARHSASLSDEERYAYLADWVLPARSHSSLRMVGKFAPPPAPSFKDKQPLGVLSPLAVKTADTKRQQTGAQLVAPPFDLVAVAKKLGRLSDIRERLSSSGDESNEEGVSQRATMLALIAMASGDFAAANEYLDKLVAASDSGDEAEHFDRWPERRW